MSSGAASGAYVAWGAYGSSKAATNSIAAHIAVEEPDITSIAVAPGRVDTDMQATIRSEGKDIMDEAQYKSFVDAFNQGVLLKPEQPGNVIAGLVAEPAKELSGKFLSYVSSQTPEIPFLANEQTGGTHRSWPHTVNDERGIVEDRSVNFRVVSTTMLVTQ